MESAFGVDHGEFSKAAPLPAFLGGPKVKTLTAAQKANKTYERLNPQYGAAFSTKKKNKPNTNLGNYGSTYRKA